MQFHAVTFHLSKNLNWDLTSFNCDIFCAKGVPSAVTFTYELKADEITLKWKEPNDNGAEITLYTVYYGTLNDNRWRETEKMTDVSVRKYVVKVEMGKKYKVLVTASNKYGESSKEDKIQRVDVPEGGLSTSLLKRVCAQGNIQLSTQ